MTKLTLSIPKGTLELAKIYSKKTRRSLSELVRQYFMTLSQGVSSEGEFGKIAPQVRRVTGLAMSDKSDDQLLWEAMKEKHRP